MGLKIGQAIRDSFNLYLNNPVVIFPFLLFGLFKSFFNILLVRYLTFSIPFNSFNPVPMLIPGSSVLAELSKTLFNYLIFIIVAIIALTVLHSFVESYSIGIARKLNSKKVSLSVGFSSLPRGIQIFAKKIIVLGLILGGSLVLYFPLIILFGTLGIVISTLLLLIFVAVVLVIEFFASQSIVIDNSGPWKGIVRSYKFIRKNLEGVVIMILFLLLLYCGVLITKAASLFIGNYFLSGTSLLLFKEGVDIILTSLIFSPFVVILKTYYFLKNK